MALTTRLNDSHSAESRFMDQHFPHTQALTGPSNKVLRASGCFCPPPVIAGAGGWYPYPEVGRAIDYRIRYLYPPTKSEELVAWQGAQLIWERAWPVVDPEIPHDLGKEVIDEFFYRLDAFLASVKPAGRLLDQAGEKMLARYCYTLSLFEDKYRRGETPEVLRLPASRQTVEELLAIAPDPVVGDLINLAKLFYQRCPDLLKQSVNLNPNLVGSADTNGADADVVIGGVLYELKTYQAPTIEAKWLRQLLGYLLLDYNDQLGIQGLAVYMVRYGQRFQWTVQEVLSALSGQVPPPNLAELRAEFREAARGETSQIEAAVAAQRAESWAEFQARRAATEVKPKPKRSRATKSK